MAEAEDVIIDAARHATSYAQSLWSRHAKRGRRPAPALSELAPRLTLLVTAVTGRAFPFRFAQPPAPPTLLTKLFRRSEGPIWTHAVPATDGTHIWLPADLSRSSPEAVLASYRIIALQQAIRALRGSASLWPGRGDALGGDLYLLFEAVAADHDLVRALPGLAGPVRALREAALAARPPAQAFPPPLRAVESVLRGECAGMLDHGAIAHPSTWQPSDSWAKAARMAARLRLAFPGKSFGNHPLYKDLWLGELRLPDSTAAELALSAADAPQARRAVPSARLARRPEVRQADEDEDEDRGPPGAWMLQTSEPQEKAEDPHGVQRPTDRDDPAAPDEFADALSELPEARLVASPTPAREVLLSDDSPQGRVKLPRSPQGASGAALCYPEWDYRSGAYHPHGASVHVVPCELGAQSWVEQTLDRHRGMLQQIRQKFELLRATRSRLRKQLDGDEIDLEAYLESTADFRAGLPRAQRLYQTQRRIQRDLALVLLIDVSGSTDSWVAAHRRIIDVEREALLLVCVALEGLGQPYAVQAFSGEGPERVLVRSVKDFNEAFSITVGQRIAGLEPEQYTRVGAAVRHATALLMQQPARHRLLVLLSDGKPNDVDQYNGRYGVEDFKRAVTEAKLQGLNPFCLTIDRQAASYLPFVLGPGHYAQLTRPELLPMALLDWVRRLVAD
jgi:nitric oxide reductase NorD protein